MSTAIEKPKEQSPKAKTDSFMHEVVIRKATYQQLLPKGMDPDWFASEVRVAVARTPSLLDCDRASVFDALSTCAQLGLSPSGRLGSAYLIPYSKRCTLVIGYRGYLDLAYRSGDVVGFRAEVVHENDHFVAREGFDLEIEHERTEQEPGALRAVYAAAEMRGGFKVRVLMWRREVMAIKGRSKTSGSGPWASDEAEMWKKTALRRLVKLLPLSPQKAQFLSRAVEAEDADFEDVEMDPAPDEPKKTQVASLKDRIKAQLPAPQPTETLTTRERDPLPTSHPDAEPPEDMVLPGQRQPGED